MRTEDPSQSIVQGSLQGTAVVTCDSVSRLFICRLRSSNTSHRILNRLCGGFGRGMVQILTRALPRSNLANILLQPLNRQTAMLYASLAVCVFALCNIAAASTGCFWANGTENPFDDDYKKCGQSSMCCSSVRDTCLDNGLCRANTGKFWRETCTSSSWDTGACLDLCANNVSNCGPLRRLASTVYFQY